MRLLEYAAQHRFASVGATIARLPSAERVADAVRLTRHIAALLVGHRARAGWQGPQHGPLPQESVYVCLLSFCALARRDLPCAQSRGVGLRAPLTWPVFSGVSWRILRYRLRRLPSASPAQS